MDNRNTKSKPDALVALTLKLSGLEQDEPVAGSATLRGVLSIDTEVGDFYVCGFEAEIGHDPDDNRMRLWDVVSPPGSLARLVGEAIDQHLAVHGDAHLV